MNFGRKNTDAVKNEEDFTVLSVAFKLYGIASTSVILYFRTWVEFSVVFLAKSTQRPPPPSPPKKSGRKKRYSKHVIFVTTDYLFKQLVIKDE